MNRRGRRLVFNDPLASLEQNQNNDSENRDTVIYSINLTGTVKVAQGWLPSTDQLDWSLYWGDG